MALILKATVTKAGEVETQSFPDGWLALYASGTLHPLHHPGEARRLEEFGETFQSAKDKGALFKVASKLCLHCGTQFGSPKLAIDAGWKPFLVVIAVLWVGQVFGFDLPWFASAVTSWLVGIGVLWVDKRMALARASRLWGEREKNFAQNNCPQCGSGNVRIASGLGRKPLELGNGAGTLVVESVGIS